MKYALTMSTTGLIYVTANGLKIDTVSTYEEGWQKITAFFERSFELKKNESHVFEEYARQARSGHKALCEYMGLTQFERGKV